MGAQSRGDNTNMEVPSKEQLHLHLSRLINTNDESEFTYKLFQVSSNSYDYKRGTLYLNNHT